MAEIYKIKNLNETFKDRKDKSFYPIYVVPHFYLLPNIDKPINLRRPVVSSSSGHTEKMFAFVDNNIKLIA